MAINVRTAYSFKQLGQQDNQEDCRYPDVDVISDNNHFFVLCDGVGGQALGEVASALVCNEFSKHLALCGNMTLTDKKIREISNLVAKTFVNEAKGRQMEMSTTMAMLCIHKNGIMAVHAGDSRIYHIRKGKILYRSEDQSLVNELIKKHIITPKEAETHPQRSTIVNCFYRKFITEGRISVVVREIKDVQSGDCFLLCSDGVTNMVSDQELTKLLSDTEMTDDKKMNCLAELSAGSADNNTAILVPIESVNVKDNIIRRIYKILNKA